MTGTGNVGCYVQVALSSERICMFRELAPGIILSIALMYGDSGCDDRYDPDL